MVLAERAVKAVLPCEGRWDDRAVETLHTSPVLSPVATRSWEAVEAGGGGTGDGEGVGDGEAGGVVVTVGAGVGVVLLCGGVVVEDEKAGGKPLMSVEASPGRHRAYTTWPRTSKVSWLGSRR